MKNEIEQTSGAAKPLPTALDVARKKTESSETPTTDHNLSCLHRAEGAPRQNYTVEVGASKAPADEPRFIEWIQSEVIRPADEIVAQWEGVRAQAREKFPDAAHLMPDSPVGMLRKPMFTLYTVAELQTLRAAQKEMTQIEKAMEPFSLSNVSQRHSAHRDDHSATLRSGEPTKALMPSRNEIFNDSLHRLQSYQAQLIEISNTTVVPLAKTIMQRFEGVVAEFLRRVEIRDREACGIMGLNFEPSAEWHAGFSIAQRYSAKSIVPRTHGYSTPRTLLKGIVDL